MDTNSTEKDNGQTFVKNTGDFHPDTRGFDGREKGSSTGDLYDQAKSLGIENYQSLDRNQLIKAIESARRSQS